MVWSTGTLRCQGHLVADNRCPPQTGDADPPRSTLPSKTHEHGKEAVDVGSALLRWLDDPDEDRGIHFADNAGGWSFRSYAELAGSVAECAGGLEQAGLGRDGIVCIAAPSGPEFVAAFFGALIAGGTPSPVAPPLIFRSADEYLSQLTRQLQAASPCLVVSDADLHPVVVEAAQAAGLDCPCLALPLAGERCDLPARPPAGLALLQFTAGSSGNPRGVRISWSNLETHLAALHEWVGWRQDDSVASWLPLYHDMGLIGTFLCAVVHRARLWLLRPEHFLRSPASWLACLGRFGATITASPSFGYAYAAKKVTSSELEGMDFSGWRVAAVGAERVDPAALERFARLVAPNGFRRAGFMPGYGLAEATLALTGSRPGKLPLLVAVDRTSLRFGDPVRVLNAAASIWPGTGGGVTGWSAADGPCRASGCRSWTPPAPRSVRAGWGKSSQPVPGWPRATRARRPVAPAASSRDGCAPATPGSCWTGSCSCLGAWAIAPRSGGAASTPRTSRPGSLRSRAFPPVGWWWCSDGSMGWTPSRRWSNASGERGSSPSHAGSAARPAAAPGC